MEFCSIASGSSGNCIFVGTDEANILIDAGISAKKICEGLKGIDIDPSDIDGIFAYRPYPGHIDFCQKIPRGDIRDEKNIEGSFGQV